MSTFGKRLKELRTNKGLTQNELGKILNVTNVGVAKWESDDRFPDKEILTKIADYFDVTTDYLLCRTDIPNSKVFEGTIEGNHVEIEIDKSYPYELTPEEVEKLISQLKEVGFDVDKLIKKAKDN